MKKPEIEFVKFNTSDVITTSGEPEQVMNVGGEQTGGQNTEEGYKSVSMYGFQPLQ